ncbi:MAG: type II toxin-antitoxin system prevent-host-death family antitoxin [Terriglobales bacterium]
MADARMKFCQILKEAITNGPQRITKYGRTTAIIVSAEEWKRMAGRSNNLAEFLTESPLHNSI